MTWRVFIDFDGTIAVPDTTDLILERFADSEWLDVEALWKAGFIGSRECMARQVGMIRATEAELDGFIADVTIDRHFSGFVADCVARGLPVKIVSDGLDRVVKSVLARIGHGDLPVAANALTCIGDSRWQLASPFADADCRSASGTCKCAVAALSPPGFGLNLLIGDGRSDHCLAQEADFVFAKDSLLGHCVDNGLPHLPFTTFAQARKNLETLLDMPFEIPAMGSTAAQPQFGIA